MYSSHKAKKQEWEYDFDMVHFIPATLFLFGVTLLLIFTPASNPIEKNVSTVASSTPTKVEKHYRLPLQKITYGKTVAPISKPIGGSVVFSDKNQPHFIASPDLQLTFLP